MATITAIIITKNEEEMIADCLDSIGFCNEILVIDSGSTDRTVDISQRMGARVMSVLTDNFSKIRNFGLEKARKDWVLYIDADERVSPELARSIQEKIQKSRTQEFSAYKLHRKNFYLGNHEWPVIENMERFFKKSVLKKWQGKLHETPLFDVPIGELDGFLLHYTHRNLSAMLTKTIIWSKTEAELRFKSGHPRMTWWRFPRVMVSAFYNSYITQQGWKVGTAGLIESMYQAFSMFVTYARLWELQNASKEPDYLKTQSDIRYDTNEDTI